MFAAAIIVGNINTQEPSDSKRFNRLAIFWECCRRFECLAKVFDLMIDHDWKISWRSACDNRN